MPEGELEELRRRKKELLLESDINRQIIRVELCQLKVKVAEVQSGLLKARTAYHWLAPAAGVFFAVYGMRRKMFARAARVAGNGQGQRRSDYLKLFAPIGVAALRKAYVLWRRARKRDRAAG